MKDNWLLIVISLVMIIFVITFIFSEVAVEDANQYEYTFSEAVESQLNNGTADLKQEEGYLVEASESEVRDAMNIDERNIFEFLPLEDQVNLSAEEADEILEGRGILEGQGEAFINAQESFNINAIYLISHAQVETGNGASELAEGISPGDDEDTYYNFFGIGAFDEQAVEAGSSYAVEENWNSPEVAIEGGAEFISSSYMENGQNTLYEMRWNPNNPGAHQYATDISWASSIAEIMEGHYSNSGLEQPEIERIYYNEDEG